MIVNILSKPMFEKWIVPKLKENFDKDTMYISILDPDNPNNFFPDSDNYKTLWFYDLEEPVGNYKIFDEDLAKETLDFILNNKDKKMCVVHCSAGVARSGAVGEFVNDILGTDDWSTFKKRNPAILPNTLVKTLLNREYEKRGNI